MLKTRRKLRLRRENSNKHMGKREVAKWVSSSGLDEQEGAQGCPEETSGMIWDDFGSKRGPQRGHPTQKGSARGNGVCFGYLNSWKCIFWDFWRFVQRTGVPKILKVHLLGFPTSCSAHRSPRIPESPFLRFPTSCSAHRSPTIPESACFWEFRRVVLRTRVQEFLKVHVFEISDVLFCAQESQNSRKCNCWYFRLVVLRTGVPEFLKVHFLIFPTSCSAHRSLRIAENTFVEISDVLFCGQESHNSRKCIFWDFRRLVLRTGVPEFPKVQLLIFPTRCSSHRSPRIPESTFFNISDVLFCAQESQNSWKYICWDFRRLVLRTGVP